MANHVDIDARIDWQSFYMTRLDRPKQSGKQIISLCPFHGDRKPSFSVNTDTGMYNCFSCARRGNAYTFLTEGGMTEDAAKQYIHDLAGIEPAAAQPSTSAYTVPEIVDGQPAEARPEPRPPRLPKPPSYTVDTYAAAKHLDAERLRAWGLTESRGSVEIPYIDSDGVARCVRRRNADGFKWRQGSAGNIIPYGVWAARLQSIKDTKTVYLVEGESDAHTMWHRGIAATLGVPGVNMWRDEWCKYLDGAETIYIHKEPPSENSSGESIDAGQIFVDKICSSLANCDIRARVYVYQLAPSGYKDPSELHCKAPAEFDAKHAAAIDAAVEVEIVTAAEQRRELVGGLKIPDKYTVTAAGVFTERATPQGSIPVVVCPTPLTPTSTLVSVHDGSEKVGLRFRRGNAWKETYAKRSTVASTNAIVQLADTGLPVNSINARLIVEYLAAVEAANTAALPRIKTSHKLGWAGQVHLPYGAGDVLLDAPSMQTYVDAFHTGGDAEAWRSGAAALRRSHPVVRAMLAASLAAPLLTPLGQRSFCLYAWCRSRGGKALSLETPIPTPSGWATMGSIQTGDEVFDEAGNICTVTKAHEVLLNQKCYKVTFSDGSEIVADAGHLWKTTSASERRSLEARTPEARAKRLANISRPKGLNPNIAESNRRRAALLPPPVDGSIRTTQEIADSLLTKSGHRNHSIEVAGPIAMPAKELPIDPYTLGVWLGDGTTASGQITTADKEVIDHLRAAGYHPQKIKDKYGWGTRGLHKQLRLLGVLGNKHIPADYLRASFEQRLALLQGIVDTDGHICDRGHIELTLTCKPLIDGVHEMLATLGIKSTMRESRATIDGKDCGPRWRIKFITELPVCRLPRRAEKQKRDGFKGTHNRRYIVAVEQVDSVPVRCITVDSPNSLYLAGWQMIPTHNTAAEKVALSIWGSPNDLMVTFNATQVGIERLAEFYSDMPLGIDEMQVASGKQDTIDRIAYMIGAGRGRVRGTKEGTIAQAATWRTIAIMTGEQELIGSTSHAGVATRVLELATVPIDKETDARDAHRLVDEHYGWAGPKYVEKIMEIVSSKEKMKGLRGRFAEIETELADAVGDTAVPSHITSVSLLCLADELGADLLFSEPQDRYDCINLGIYILETVRLGDDGNADGNADDLDMSRKITTHIREWCASNKDHFTGERSPAFGVEEDGEYRILQTVLASEVEKMGWKKRQVYKALRDSGALEVAQDGTNAKSCRVNGSVAKCVVLRRWYEDDL